MRFAQDANGRGTQLASDAMSRSSRAIERDLLALLGTGSVLAGTTSAYLTDATESRKLRGRADAVALPANTAEVAQVVAWCYDHDVAIVPRGGGTGFAGGAVPLDGGVVLGLERLRGPARIEPELWRAQVPAGVPTATLRRQARENGLLFPPDPGAAEQSQIGGNIATNAGGPHAFKYGVTGAWVTGVDVVIPPGELVTIGGPIRKDVAGYDLKSLVVGSEGTLGVVTGAWLRLVPAPEAALPVVAFCASAELGCAAILSVFANGLAVAALEYLDEGSIAMTRGGFPGEVPSAARFMLIVEADGSPSEAERLRLEVVEGLGEYALSIQSPTDPAAINRLWLWRDGVSLVASAQRGGKFSEDIVVPLDRFGEALDATLAIGRRHSLPTCSWGHAGDGNLHSTFLVNADDSGELARAEQAAEELFVLAAALGGSISGEHGVGLVKRGALAHQWMPPALALHEAVKRAFDPKGLLNPGKKLGRPIGANSVGGAANTASSTLGEHQPHNQKGA
jgi:glycolate oxidase subunit GlcD